MDWRPHCTHQNTLQQTREATSTHFQEDAPGVHCCSQKAAPVELVSLVDVLPLGDLLGGMEVKNGEGVGFGVVVPPGRQSISGDLQLLVKATGLGPQHSLMPQ